MWAPGLFNGLIRVKKGACRFLRAYAGDKGFYGLIEGLRRGDRWDVGSRV